MSKYDFSAFEGLGKLKEFVKFDCWMNGELLIGEVKVGKSKIPLDSLFYPLGFFELKGLENLVEEIIEDKEIEFSIVNEMFTIKIDDNLSFEVYVVDSIKVYGNFIYRIFSFEKEVPFKKFFGSLSKNELIGLKNTIAYITKWKYNLG